MKLVVCIIAALAVFQTATCYLFLNGSEEIEVGSYEYFNVSDVIETSSVPPKNRFMDAQEKGEALREVLSQYQKTSVLKDLKQNTENICPGHGEKFVNATLKAMNCLQSVDENQETSCSMVQNHLSRCMKYPIHVLEKCLPDNAREIPSMVLKMIINISKKLCRTDGEHLFELGNPCIMSRNHRTESCIRRVRARTQQYMKNIPSAFEICEFLSSLRPCAQSHLVASCGNQKTRESFMDLFDAALLSCDSYHTNVIEDDVPGQYEIVSPEPYGPYTYTKEN